MKQILTCCFNETDALLNEHWDWPLKSDHGGKRHTKVVAFDGFGNGMPGFGSWFLDKKTTTTKQTRTDWWEHTREIIQHYLSLSDKTLPK